MCRFQGKQIKKYILFQKVSENLFPNIITKQSLLKIVQLKFTFKIPAKDYLKIIFTLVVE